MMQHVRRFALLILSNLVSALARVRARLVRSLKVLCIAHACACRFMTNPKRMCASDVCHCFAATQVCVDRVHFKNHTDRWCKQHMDPDSIPEMMGVNTEVGKAPFW